MVLPRSRAGCTEDALEAGRSIVGRLLTGAALRTRLGGGGNESYWEFQADQLEWTSYGEDLARRGDPRWRWRAFRAPRPSAVAWLAASIVRG